MNYPTERAAKCPNCGANPGHPCYGNGAMAPGSHSLRTLKALTDEIDRLRAQIDQLSSKTSQEK